MPNAKSRAFIATWNNPDTTVEELRQLLVRAGAQWFAGQLERGANGTLHA